MFGQKFFITYKLGCEYYGLNEKPMIRMAWASGTVYKIGKRVLIKDYVDEVKSYLSKILK